MIITVCVILFSGHGFDVFTRACEVYRSGRQVCTPQDPWIWSIPCAGIVGVAAGAAAGALGTSIFRRVRIRLSRAPTIFN
jgi:hypothetical protein